MKEQKRTDPVPTNNEERNGSVKYVPPRIITYTSEQILEQIGPAQTGSNPFCTNG